MLLLAQQSFPGLVEAATVDHKLRPEAAAEAEFCAQLCAGYSIPHTTLAVEQPLEGNIQSAARAARYDLLATWAKERGLAFVLTAHHADDQVETFLMRLKRGAGVGGLSSIRQHSLRTNGLHIIRPLLGWTRSELEAIVGEAGIEPVRDPSNHNEAFDRVKVRNLLATLSSEQREWLAPLAISAAAQRLADADDALTWTARHHADQLISTNNDSIRIAPAFASLPSEIQRRILKNAIQAIDNTNEIRGTTLESALTDMLALRKTMLGNWLIIPAKKSDPNDTGGWRIERAPPRHQARP